MACILLGHIRLSHDADNSLTGRGSVRFTQTQQQVANLLLWHTRTTQAKFAVNIHKVR